jgi:hypothetical protein
MKEGPRNKVYRTNCVSAKEESITNMVDTSREIARETFLCFVDPWSIKTLEEGLGYATDEQDGVTMANDYHVTYYMGYFEGRECVYFKQSDIEYVFIADNNA